MEARFKAAVEQRLRTAIKEAVSETMQELLVEQVLPDVPVKSGALRESGRVVVEEGPDGSIIGRIVFGGGDIDYAVFVHEDLSVHHDTGSAKFLETPLFQNREQIARRVAERVRQKLGS